MNRGLLLLQGPQIFLLEEYNHDVVVVVAVGRLIVASFLAGLAARVVVVKDDTAPNEASTPYRIVAGLVLLLFGIAPRSQQHRTTSITATPNCCRKTIIGGRTTLVLLLQ